MKYTPRKYFAHNLATGVVTTAKVGKKIVTTSSNDPAVSNDTGEGYAIGSMWLNTTSGEQFVAIDVSAEGSVWVNQSGDDINNDPYQGTNYGFYLGGGNGSDVDEISRWSLTSPHAGSDYGDLVAAGSSYGTVTDAGKTKCFVLGGKVAGQDSYEECSTFNFTAPVGATDVGDLSEHAHAFAINCQTPSLGILGGGVNIEGGVPQNILTTIQSFSTIAPHAGVDISEMAVSTRHGSSSESPTHGYTGGGATPGQVDTITRYQKGTSDNSSDIGELASSSGAYGGGATDGRGGFGYHISGQNTGGTEVDVIQKYPFTSPTSGSDVGEASYSGGPAGRNMSGHMVSGIEHFYHVDYTSGASSIWKGPFSAPATITDVGEAATAATYGTGTQY